MFVISEKSLFKTVFRDTDCVVVTELTVYVIIP